MVTFNIKELQLERMKFLNKHLKFSLMLVIYHIPCLHNVLCLCYIAMTMGKRLFRRNSLLYIFSSSNFHTEFSLLWHALYLFINRYISVFLIKTT